MPVMDGVTATRRIRALEAAEPQRGRAYISALTANASPEDEQDCRRSGMDDYLSKVSCLPGRELMLLLLRGGCGVAQLTCGFPGFPRAASGAADHSGGGAARA